MPQLNIKLPDPPKPAGTYVPAIRVGNLVYLSGQIPLVNGEIMYKGKLGRDMNLEQGYQAARVCALNALSALKEEIRDLAKVRRIVRLSGYVNCMNDFVDQSKVVNGASEVMTEVFGQVGFHTRIAIGASSLPLNSAVELELIVEVSK